MARTHVLLALLLALPTQAAEEAPLQASPEQLDWFREARFGLFVHWGPVSLKGTEIGWSRGGERRGTGGNPGPIAVDVYDHLYEQFNPTEFDADQWVAIAKAAGMRYLVFTSKHHDGFCMFGTKLTDHSILNSPFKRDIVGELAAACHRAGLKLGFYYSPPDWHHPDYRTERHARYVTYLHGQLEELCSNYGKVDVIWFDGLGGTATDWDSERLERRIRELQPGVLINNRAGLPADFDTPEQRVGGFQRGRPWESCITICQQWAWRPDDRLKSLQECIGTLVRCAGGDGNLLLNVGPMPTGAIEPRQVDRLKAIGAWLDRYGETIYGTRGGPYKPGRWGAATCRGNMAYLHVLSWEEAPLTLPPLPAKVLSAKLLTGGTVEVTQTDDALTIDVPAADRQELDTIVELQLDRPVLNLEPVPTILSGSLAMGRPATASNVYQKDPNWGPDKALDDDDSTRWATDAGISEAWLEVDLGEPKTIGRAVIREVFDRVQRFQMERQEGDGWVPFVTGTAIGDNREVKFDPITVQRVRLHILEATNGPTFWEFQLFPPNAP